MIHWMKFKINIKLNKCFFFRHMDKCMHDNFFFISDFSTAMSNNNNNNVRTNPRSLANLNSTHEHSSVQFDFQMSNLIKKWCCAISLLFCYCYNKFKRIQSRIQSKYFSHLSFAIYFNLEMVRISFSFSTWICFACEWKIVCLISSEVQVNSFFDVWIPNCIGSM